MSSQQPLPQGDNSRGNGVTAMYWIITSISGLILALRFWSRHISKTTGADDWLMLLSWLCLLAISIMATFLNSLGGFQHLMSIPPDQVSFVLKILWATQPFGIIGLIPGKVAVGITVLRIRGSTASALFRWGIYVLSVITFIVGAVTVFLQFFQCNPPSALWNPGAPAQCFNPAIYTAYGIFSGAWNSLVDFTFACLPATFILRLKMSLRRRLLLSLLLGLGLVTGAASIVKTTTLSQLGARADITWELYDLYIWQGLEMALIVVLGSAALLKPVYDKLFGKPNASISYGGSKGFGASGSHYALASSGKKNRSYLRQNSTGSATDLQPWTPSDPAQGTYKIKVTRDFDVYQMEPAQAPRKP